MERNYVFFLKFLSWYILPTQCLLNLQVATHDVTDSTCMRGWLNSPVGLSMEQEIYKATNTVRAYYKVLIVVLQMDIFINVCPKYFRA